MDVLALVALVGTIVSSTASLAQSGRSFYHVIPELERQIAEVDVLLLVLEDTTKTFIEHGSLPKPVIAATERCSSSYAELMLLLNRLVQREKEGKSNGRWRVKRQWKAIATEQERRAAYHAFRDSVLLLRDLASE